MKMGEKLLNIVYKDEISTKLDLSFSMFGVGQLRRSARSRTIIFKVRFVFTGSVLPWTEGLIILKAGLVCPSIYDTLRFVLSYTDNVWQFFVHSFPNTWQELHMLQLSCMLADRAKEAWNVSVFVLELLLVMILEVKLMLKRIIFLDTVNQRAGGDCCICIRRLTFLSTSLSCAHIDTTTTAERNVFCKGSSCAVNLTV